jgi:hypothetical protein
MAVIVINSIGRLLSKPTVPEYLTIIITTTDITNRDVLRNQHDSHDPEYEGKGAPVQYNYRADHDGIGFVDPGEENPKGDIRTKGTDKEYESTVTGNPLKISLSSELELSQGSQLFSSVKDRGREKSLSSQKLPVNKTLASNSPSTSYRNGTLLLVYCNVGSLRRQHLRLWKSSIYTT